MPNDPALVVQDGASETVSIALELLPALPSLFSARIKYVPSTGSVKFAVIEVALVKVTVLAAVIAPVEAIASTCGIETKLVPAITTLVASLVIVLGVTPVTVGFVSVVIVTDPPKETADPFIVIDEFAKSTF